MNVLVCNKLCISRFTNILQLRIRKHFVGSQLSTPVVEHWMFLFPLSPLGTSLRCRVGKPLLWRRCKECGLNNIVKRVVLQVIRVSQFYSTAGIVMTKTSCTFSTDTKPKRASLNSNYTRTTTTSKIISSLKREIILHIHFNL